MLVVSLLSLSFVACDEFTLKIEGLSSEEEEETTSNSGSQTNCDPTTDPTVDPGDPDLEVAPPEAGCQVDVSYSYRPRQVYTHSYSMTYDGAGRLASTIYPYGRHRNMTTTYHYDDHGNISDVEYDMPGNANDFDYLYDYTYDDEDRLISMTLDYDGIAGPDQTTLYVYENDTHRTVYTSYANYPQIYLSEEYINSDGHVVYSETSYDDGMGNLYIYSITTVWDGDHMLLNTTSSDSYSADYGNYHYDSTEYYEYEDDALVHYSYGSVSAYMDYDCYYDNNENGKPDEITCITVGYDTNGNVSSRTQTETEYSYDSAGRQTHVSYDYGRRSHYDEQWDWTCPAE